MLAWMLASVASAACPEPVTLDAFREGVARAWDLAVADETQAFRAEMAALQADTGCLAAPLAPADAAAFHRNRALVSSSSGDPESATSSAGAAARLAPETVEAWAEASSAFAALLASSSPADTRLEFSASLATRVFVDGTATNERPVGHPVFVQVFAPDGGPVGGAWVDARSPLPDWVTYPPAQCPSAVRIAALVAAVEQAEQAFVHLDVDGFGAALRTVAEGLPCADGVVAPPEAAAIHRLEGMRLFTLGAELGALRSFQESRLLDPTWVPSPEVVPPDSTLEALWRSAGTLGAPPWITMHAPEALQMRVDGIVASERPATLPAIVQATTVTGQVLWTRYVPATATLPDLSAHVREAQAEQDTVLPPALRIYQDEEARRPRVQRRQALVLGGAGLLFASGMLYKSNANLLSDFDSRETPPEFLQPTRNAANRAATASSVVGAVGLGLIGVAIALP